MSGRTRARRRAIVWAGLAAGWLGTSVASGQFFTWTNVSGGTFSVASNWNPAGPPSTTAHAAFFTLPATYTVTLTTSPNIGSINVSAGTVTLNGGAQTLSLAGAANINNGGTLRLTSGTLSAGGLASVGTSGNGTLSINGATARGVFGNTVVGLSGGVARVEVLGGATASFASIDVADSTNAVTRGTLFVGAGSTISFSSLDIAAQSVGGAVGTLLVSGRAATTAGALVDVGSPTAAGSGLLQVDTGGAFGSADAGTMNINSTGRLFVNGGSVDAGTHVNLVGGRIDFSASTSALDLADTNAGTLTVSGGGTMTAGSLSAIDNDRYFIVDSNLSVETTLTVGSSGAFGVLNVFGAAARLTGGNLSVNGFGGALESQFVMSTAAVGTLGNISLNGSTSSPFLGIGSGARLTAGNLHLSGAVANSATFSMSGGTSEFNQTGSSTVTIGNTGITANAFAGVSGGTWTTGTGQFLINPSGQLSISNTGYVRPGGSVQVDGGKITTSGNSTLDIAGSLEVVNEGSISLVGNGQVAVAGGATFGSTAEVTINGPNAALRIAGPLSASIFVPWNVQNGLLEFGGTDYGGSTGANGEFFATQLPTDIATVQINGGSFNGFGAGSVKFYNLHNGGTGTAGLNRLNFVNNASMTMAATLSIGRNAAAEVNVLSGSDVSVGTLSGPFDATGAAAILVDGLGSTVTTTDLWLGLPAGPASAASARIRNGGSMTVNGNAVLLGAAEIHVEPGGTLFLGDAATIGSEFVSSTGRLRVNGGTLSALSPAVLLAHAGPFEFSGGTIALRSASTLDPTTQARLLGPARTLGPGQTLSVAGVASLAGGGAQPLTIDGGVLTVGTLANTAGGLVLRSGTLSLSSPLVVGASFPLGGNAYVGPNAAINVANTGSIAAASRLTLDRASLVANSFANAGELRLLDDARVSASTFINSGTLGGSGQIAAIVTNSAGARIRLTPADQLTTNLISNNGSIDFLGGRLHVTSNLNNNTTGAIVGWGNLQVDGTLGNLGTITFTGGTADVQASLTNNAGGRVTVTGGSHTTVYGTVANITGSQFRVAEASVAAFLGNVIGLGAFTGPGTKIFESTASGGPIVSDVGRTRVESTGALTALSIRDRRLEVAGSAALAFNALPTVSRLNELSIDGGPSAWTGRLDLTNNALVIDYAVVSPLPTVADQIRLGYAGGDWTGNGIRSSVAATTPNRAIGYAEATDLGSPVSFLGEPIDGTALLLRLTLPGDANLDATVTIGDFALLAANFNVAASTWSRGDFNYDTTTGIGDFALLAANFNQSLPAGLPRASVPEPGVGLFGGLGLTILVRSRRRTPGSRKRPC